MIGCAETVNMHTLCIFKAEAWLEFFKWFCYEEMGMTEWVGFGYHVHSIHFVAASVSNITLA